LSVANINKVDEKEFAAVLQSICGCLWRLRISFGRVVFRMRAVTTQNRFACNKRGLD
jgi:hypothetical protein